MPERSTVSTSSSRAASTPRTRSGRCSRRALSASPTTRFAAASSPSGAGGEVEVELDRAAAIARAVDLARPGDVVLVAGKGAEQGQEFADRTIPFDDREAAKEALRALEART